MEVEIVLSRLTIVKELDRHTPLCVLEEMLDAHRIGYKKGVIQEEYRREIIAYIRSHATTILVPPLHTKDYRILAAYINVDRKLRWTPKTLLSALDYLHTFQTPKKNLSEINPDFQCGGQTPENLEKLNACVLYRICRDHHLTLRAHTTLEQMGNAVKFLLAGPDHTFQVLTQFYQTSQPKDILNALVLGTVPILSPELSQPPLTRDRLNDFTYATPYLDLTSCNNLAKRVIPTSSMEAVALAALIFQKDISLSKVPLCEYRRLQRSLHGYIPYDETLRRIYILNPTLLDLTKTFNPLFPEQYYQRDDLLRMAFAEGFSVEELHTDVYTILQISQLLENFYPGIYPEIHNEETPITCDEVAALDPGLIVCYGVRRERLTAFNIEGLLDHFKIVKTFAHPTDPSSTMEPQAIKKLKCIAENSEDIGSEESRRLKQELLDVLEEVEFFSSSTLEKAHDLYNHFTNASPEDQEAIRQGLYRLLHIAMYMRGWEGEGHGYPVRGAPVLDQIAVDLKVTEAVAHFEEVCEGLGTIGNLLGDLPLLRYQGEFNPSNTSSNGYTIGERLEIVKEGNETENMASCIRLSSNWLAASAYRYLTFIGEPPPFPVEELRYIS